MTVPAGGPATINGILYQMLWCLLQVAKIYVQERGFEKDDRDNEIKSAQLLIEPAGGGGDAQRGPRIVQLKAKSDEGSWSLQDVIAKVFPDLYRAANPQEDSQVFEFVTEGTIGQWGEVYKEFFHSLRTRLVPDGNPLDALDDKTEVFKPKNRRETAKSESFWDQALYTERTLFLRIAGELRKSKPAAEELEELTYRKLWHLLGRFEFTGGQTQEQLRREVESLLLAIIPSKDQIGAKCNELIGALSTIATRGNVTIHAADFLREHYLGSLPLNPEGWPALRKRARTEWQRRRSQLGYEPGQDVRSGRAEETRGRWSPDSPILVLSGESGQGKSWLLYALGEIVSTEPPLVLLIEATGQKESDLAQAKDDFVEMIWGHDEGPALRRIGERIRETVPQLKHPWLTLLIDGLQDSDEADQLARVPWEDWGIRVALSASPQAAEAIRAASRGRSVQVPVPDFDEEDLSTFLEAYCGEQWIEIPGDVRRVLRRPLLASLYRSVADRPSWRPTTEYELLERFWDRLHEGRQVRVPMDASICTGSPFPS